MKGQLDLQILWRIAVISLSDESCLSQAHAGGPLSCTSQPHFNPIGHQAIWFVSLLRQFFGVRSYYS